MNVFNRLFGCLILLTLMSCGVNHLSIDERLAKERNNPDETIRDLKRKGWEIDSGSKTLELAFLEHVKKRMDNKNLYDIEGNVTKCFAINICRSVARSNAIKSYADLSGSKIEGLVSSDTQYNSSGMTTEEFNNFYANYIRSVKANIGKILRESYSLVKKHGDSKNYKDYKMVFIVDENNALKERRNAMRNALELSGIPKSKSLIIEKYITENPLKYED